ncbi:MAG: MFS transporter, partial [Candidatus Hodarchaeota archaeon]
PFSGVIADRWNKKVIIAISDTLQAFLTFLLFIFFLFDFQNIWLVLTANTFAAALFAFQYPTVQSLIPAMVPKENLSRINGMNFLFAGVIFSVGPMIAATLLSFFPITQIFLIDIITFVIALVPLLLIKIPKVQQITEEATKKSFFKDFKTGLMTIKMVPGLLAMIMLAMIWNFLHRPWAVLTPYFIRYTHDGTAFDLAMIMTMSQVANIIGSIIMSIKKTWKHKIKINIIGASIFFIGMLPAIFAPKGNFILMIISLFSGWLLFPITVSTYLAILQIVVSKDKIGRIMSIDHMISMAIAPIGAIIAGPLAELMGIVNLFLIFAIVGAVFPIFIWYFTKIRQLEIIDRQKMAETEEIEEVEEIEKEAEIPEIVQIAETIE